MATLTKTGITTGNTIQAGHVTQSVDAFTGLVAYDIILSGSLVLTGSVRSQNGFTGSLFGTSSWALRSVSGSYADASQQTNTVYVTSSNSTSPIAIALLNQTSSGAGTSGVRFDDGLKYQPSNDTLYAANFEGTASVAVTASYVATVGSAATIVGVAVPSGSAPITANLYFIAGAAQTNPLAVTVALPTLAGKVLGQNCFVTIGVTGSAATDLVTVTGLAGPNLTFTSQNANTNFHYHIMYY